MQLRTLNLYSTGNHHAESGNTDYQLQLEVWKGNIGKALELAVERKQLSDWLVAISHLGNHINPYKNFTCCSRGYTKEKTQVLLLKCCYLLNKIGMMLAGLYIT